MTCQFLHSCRELLVILIQTITAVQKYVPSPMVAMCAHVQWIISFPQVIKVVKKKKKF